jgi:hypothetical protein
MTTHDSNSVQAFGSTAWQRRPDHCVYMNTCAMALARRVSDIAQHHSVQGNWFGTAGQPAGLGFGHHT